MIVRLLVALIIGFLLTIAAAAVHAVTLAFVMGGIFSAVTVGLILIRPRKKR